MIKHICICDKCKKEEDMRSQSKWVVNGEDRELFNHYILPEHWEEHGIMPKYLLCGECSSTLKNIIQGEIYKFVNWDRREGE